MTFRVGAKLGRTIYQQLGDQPSWNDRMIGVMDTPELGALVVEALNARERVLKAGFPLARLETAVAPDTCGRVGMHNCEATGRWQNHEEPT